MAMPPRFTEQNCVRKATDGPFAQVIQRQLSPVLVESLSQNGAS
jgi:hypothetical protein